MVSEDEGKSWRFVSFNPNDPSFYQLINQHATLALEKTDKIYNQLKADKDNRSYQEVILERKKNSAFIFELASNLVRRGNFEQLKQLMDLYPDAHSKSDGSITLLHIATNSFALTSQWVPDEELDTVIEGRVQIVQYLLEKHASLAHVISILKTGPETFDGIISRLSKIWDESKLSVKTASEQRTASFNYELYKSLSTLQIKRVQPDEISQPVAEPDQCKF